MTKFKSNHIIHYSPSIEQYSKMPSSIQIQKWKITEPYLNLHCQLGEAPFHEVATNTLRFVDIKKKQLHTFSLDEGPKSLQTLQLDMPVGVTADIEGVDPKERILVGGKEGIAVLERGMGTYVYLKRFYDEGGREDRLRSNDGAVDSRGRFWVGTMNDFHVGTPGPEGWWVFLLLISLEFFLR